MRCITPISYFNQITMGNRQHKSYLFSLPPWPRIKVKVIQTVGKPQSSEVTIVTQNYQTIMSLGNTKFNLDQFQTLQGKGCRGLAFKSPRDLEWRSSSIKHVQKPQFSVNYKPTKFKRKQFSNTSKSIWKFFGTIVKTVCLKKKCQNVQRVLVFVDCILQKSYKISCSSTENCFSSSEPHDPWPGSMFLKVLSVYEQTDIPKPQNVFLPIPKLESTSQTQRNGKPSQRILPRTVSLFSCH